MTKLESTLASALKAEGDRSTADLDTATAARRLEAGFDRIDRDRRQRTWRTALAAAAAVLVAAGVYGVIKLQSTTSDEPARPPHTTNAKPYSSFTQYGKPGTYQLHVGRDATGVPINADLTFYVDGWGVGNYPVLSEPYEKNSGGVAVYRPTALAAGSGCLAGKEIRSIGQNRTELAEQLVDLPKSTVLQSPTSVQAFGQPAIHLRLRINPWCLGGVYRVAWTHRGGHGISYGDTPRKVVIDFWAMNVRGVPVVVESWYQVGAPSWLVDQVARTKDSIQIVTDPASRGGR